MALSFLLTVISVSAVLWALRGGYGSGVSTAIFLLVLLPKTVFLFNEQLSAHRFIVVVLVLYSLVNRNYLRSSRPRDLILFLVAIGLFKLVSAYLGLDRASSLKRLVSYTLEVLLFVAVILDYCRTREDVERYLWSAFLALGAASALGIAEKYLGLVVLNYLPAPGGGVMAMGGFGRTLGIRSTFLHPILFGTAMSMGWPLGFYFLQQHNGRGRNLLIWALVFSMFANVYFSVSRGAWIASMVLIVLLFLLWRSKGRKRLAVILFLAASVLMVNSGVMTTITSLVDATFNPRSVEGASFSYRMELWREAYRQVSKSARTLLWGYGEEGRKVLPMDQVRAGTGHFFRFISWDSEYAVLLLETGFIGLVAHALLFLSLLGALLNRYLASEPGEGMLVATVMAVILIFNLMMTIVKIYAAQLWFLLWAIVCVGYFLRDTLSWRKVQA